MPRRPGRAVRRAGCAGRLAPGAVVMSPPPSRHRMRAAGGGSRTPRLPLSRRAGVRRRGQGGVGEMTSMASGSRAAFRQGASVLDAVDTKVGSRRGGRHRRDGQGRVSAPRPRGIAVAAEALSLAIRAGADPRHFDAVTSAAGNSWMFENRMARVLEGDDAPRSAVDIFVKDLGLVAGRRQPESPRPRRDDGPAALHRGKRDGPGRAGRRSSSGSGRR